MRTEFRTRFVGGASITRGSRASDRQRKRRGMRRASFLKMESRSDYGFFLPIIVSFFIVVSILCVVSIFMPVSVVAAAGAGAIAGVAVSLLASSDLEHAVTASTAAAAKTRRFM